MAKVRPGLISLSGKLGNEVIVAGRRYTSHIRRAPKSGTKVLEGILKKNYIRTAFLNELASEINNIIHCHSDNFKSSRFYEELQKRFRQEPLNNKCLLLLKLKGMEVRPEYPLTNLGKTEVTVKGLKNNIVVTLKVTAHPPKTKHKANCYCFEMLLVTWDNSQRPAKCKRQYSDWINLKDSLPEFDFEFPKPAGITQWMLCLRSRLGLDEELLEIFTAEGMQIVEVGSFDPKEKALMNKKIASKSLTAKANKSKPKVVRVKAKKKD